MSVVRDLTSTARGLVRRPSYAMLVLATIVLGAGSITAAYGLLHQVILRPLPYEDVERLVAVRTLYGSDVFGVTTPEYARVAQQADAFRSVAALVEPALDEDWTWTFGTERRSLRAAQVTDDFFTTLGVVPELGTLAGAEGERRVVVSRQFWETALGGDPEIIGRPLQVNAEPHIMLGVLPSSFEFPLGPEPVDVWVVFTPQPEEAYEGMPLRFRPVARIEPGVTREQAADQVIRLVEQVRAQRGEAPGRTVVRPLVEDLVGSARSPLRLLTLAGLLVLLVASLNLSLLIGARNEERRDELRMRAALGAGRGRIVRHLLAETAVLALVGSAAAWGVATLVLERVFQSGAGGLVRVDGAGVGVEIALVAVAAASVPALLAAVLPALRLTQGARGTRGASADRKQRRFAWMLTTVESGVVFALLVVAGLLLRSLREVTAVEPGFDTTSTVAMTVFIPPDRYPPYSGSAAEVLVSLERALAARPGIVGTGAISNLPLSPESWSGSLEIEGVEDLGADGAVVVDWELVTPGYFEAMGIPLREGRVFDTRDGAGQNPVVIVNETLARRWWPEGNVLGSRMSGGGPLRTIVGVVGDVKQQGLHSEARGFMYLPVLQVGAASKQEIVIRVEGEEPGNAVADARAALLDVEPNLAVGTVRTLSELVQDSVGSFRLRAILFGAFGTMAMLLGMAGIYGITAHGVRLRHRDIGIRMAMGAEQGHVMAGVFLSALTPVAIGLAGGLVLLLASGSVLRGLLFGVAPADPHALLGVGLLLLASGAAAVAPSALWARRVDPAEMLRNE